MPILPKLLLVPAAGRHRASQRPFRHSDACGSGVLAGRRRPQGDLLVDPLQFNATRLARQQIANDREDPGKGAEAEGDGDAVCGRQDAA